MLRVDSFLNCVKLESFGLWIGWFEYGMSIFVAFGSVIAAAFIVKDAVNSDSFVKGLSTVVTLLIILVICTFVASMCEELLKGIKSRDSEGVKVFRNLCIFNVFFAGFLIMLSESVEVIKTERNSLLLMSWCNFLLQAYVLLCIHSLALKLDEHRFPSLIRSSSREFYNEFDDDDYES